MSPHHLFRCCRRRRHPTKATLIRPEPKRDSVPRLGQHLARRWLERLTEHDRERRLGVPKILAQCIKEVQDALGHRTLAMTLRYSHLAPEHLRAAVAVLDDVLPARAELGQKSQRVTEATQTIPA